MPRRDGDGLAVAGDVFSTGPGRRVRRTVGWREGDSRPEIRAPGGTAECCKRGRPGEQDRDDVGDGPAGVPAERGTASYHPKSGWVEGWAFSNGEPPGISPP